MKLPDRPKSLGSAALQLAALVACLLAASYAADAIVRFGDAVGECDQLCKLK